MDMVLATKNRKKADEMKRIINAGIRGHRVRILTLDDFPGCPDITEDGSTFEENAVKKAVFVSQYAGMPALADDSGLEVDALNGAPGVFSARYAGEPADDAANINKLLKDLRGVVLDGRSARFVCCVALVHQDTVRVFSGYVSGVIAVEPKGTRGFGYDPVFYPEGRSRTFAEMDDDEKNLLSHRGRALRELQRYLEERGFKL